MIDFHRKAKVGKKVTSLADAVNRFVNDGDSIYLATGSGRFPEALAYEIIRQKKKNLNLLSAGLDHTDMLVGAGCVKRLEGAYYGLEEFGLAPCVRRALEKGIPHKIEVEDYSNHSFDLMFFASAHGLPFMPTLSLKGSDLERIQGWKGSKKLATVTDPFTGREVVVLPSLTPDVVMIHVQWADAKGNIQAWGSFFCDIIAAKAARKLLVSVEDIVDEATIRRDPNRTVLPWFMVDAVVKAPWGAHPRNVPGYYDMDEEFRAMYAKMARTVEGFEQFLNEWVYGVENHEGYLRKLGTDRLMKLKAKPYPSTSVDYGMTI